VLIDECKRLPEERMAERQNFNPTGYSANDNWTRFSRCWHGARPL
jgi:hypothetical protein